MSLAKDGLAAPGLRSVDCTVLLQRKPGSSSMISLTTAAVLLCVFSGLFFLALWMYYDRRDHRLFEGERRHTTYHCIRCDHVYGIRGSKAEAECPKCGQRNSRLHY